MGFNSVLLICNDAMSAIDADPVGWRQAAKTALCAHPALKPKTFGFKGYANYFAAVWNQHADVVAVLVVGGNTSGLMHYTTTLGGGRALRRSAPAPPSPDGRRPSSWDASSVGRAPAF